MRPFYLRRTKEALVSFPDPETGAVTKLFTNREVRTAAFELDGEEFDFYDALTRYVEDQSIQASADDSARGRAVGFTMAMLQRRMASSVYAVRRSLERMKDRREKILADPEAYRQRADRAAHPRRLRRSHRGRAAARSSPSSKTWWSRSTRQRSARRSPSSQRADHQARHLEGREVESKLAKLRAVLTEQGIFDDPKMKLLLFTEHKDTLDYLAGDGKDGRPLGKLREWGLAITQIHGGMKIGDRDTAGQPDLCRA